MWKRCIQRIYQRQWWKWIPRAWRNRQIQDIWYSSKCSKQLVSIVSSFLFEEMIVNNVKIPSIEKYKNNMTIELTTSINTFFFFKWSHLFIVYWKCIHLTDRNNNWLVPHFIRYLSCMLIRYLAIILHAYV